MATTLAEAQDIRNRVSSLRQLLEDFDKTVDFVSHAQSDKNSLTADVEALKKERDDLTAELQKTKDKVKSAKQDEAKKAADADQAHAAKVAKQQAELDQLKAQTDEAEKNHAYKMADMQNEYGNQLAMRKKEIADAEARLSALIELIEGHKAAAARL